MWVVFQGCSRIITTEKVHCLVASAANDFRTQTWPNPFPSTLVSTYYDKFYRTQVAPRGRVVGTNCFFFVFFNYTQDSGLDFGRTRYASSESSGLHHRRRYYYWLNSTIVACLHEVVKRQIELLIHNRLVAVNPKNRGRGEI